MKRVIIISLLFLFSFLVRSQSVLEISFCDKMINKRKIENYQVYLILKSDTFHLADQTGNKYLLSKNIFDNEYFSTGSDSAWVFIKLQTAKYYYILCFTKRDILMPKLSLCIDNKKNRFGNVKVEYRSYNGSYIGGFTRKIKKK